MLRTENLWCRRWCNFQCLEHIPALCLPGAWLLGLEASWNNAAVWKSKPEISVHAGAVWKLSLSLVTGHGPIPQWAWSQGYSPCPLEVCVMLWTPGWAVPAAGLPCLLLRHCGSLSVALPLLSLPVLLALTGNSTRSMLLWHIRIPKISSVT